MKSIRRIPLFISVFVVFFILSGCFNQPPTFEFELQPSTNIFTMPGEVITYSYIVKNTGAVLMNVNITDNELGSCTSGGDQIVGGGEFTCEISYTTTEEDVAAGMIQNSAMASGNVPTVGCVPGSDSATKNASAVVMLEVPITSTSADAAPADAPPAMEIFPELTVEMSASPAGYSKANEIIIYTYTVHNTGFAEVQGPFSVVDNRIQQWECDDAGVSGYSLPSDGYISCKAYYRVQPGDICAQVTNTGHIEGTSVSGTVTSNEVGTTVFYVGNCTDPEPDDPAPVAPQPACEPWWSPGCQ